MSLRQVGSPVQVTMQSIQQRAQQPVQSSGPQSSGEAPSFVDLAGAPMPLRWQKAVENMESLLSNMDQLTQALDGALYLDDDEWQKAIPVHRYTMAVQVQHQRITELERQLADMSTRLAESERGRAGAEARVKELNGELENNARVFQLHYEELMRKEREISDLQAVVGALSLGGGGRSVSSFGGAGSSDGEDETGMELGSLRL